MHHNPTNAAKQYTQLVASQLATLKLQIVTAAMHASTLCMCSKMLQNNCTYPFQITITHINKLDGYYLNLSIYVVRDSATEIGTHTGWSQALSRLAILFFFMNSTLVTILQTMFSSSKSRWWGKLLTWHQLHIRQLQEYCLLSNSLFYYAWLSCTTLFQLWIDSVILAVCSHFTSHGRHYAYTFKLVFSFAWHLGNIPPLWPLVVLLSHNN